MKKLLVILTMMSCLFLGNLSYANAQNVQEITVPIDKYFAVKMPYAFYKVDKSFAEQVRENNENGLIFRKIGDTLIEVYYPISFTPPRLEKVEFLIHVVPQEDFSSTDFVKNGDRPNSSGDTYTENIDVSQYAQQVLELVNIERTKVGARPLKLANDLQEGAAIRAKELTKFYSHTRPNGRECFTVLHVTGREWLGENIAAGQVSPEQVVESWMNSAGHRENILQNEYSELGVGYYFDENATYKHYWVQLFRG